MQEKRHPINLSNFGTTLAVVVLTFMSMGTAYGHTVGISRGDYRLNGADVLTELVFARPELAGSVPGLDSNHDGTISQSEVNSGRDAIDKFFIAGLDVRSASGLCTGTLTDVELTEEDGIILRALFRCPVEPGTISFNLKLLERLSHGHRHLANAVSGVSGSQNTHMVVYAGNTNFQIDTTHGATGNSTERQSWSDAILPLFRLGIQHILSGYDHLLFLVGLILVAGRIRSLMVVITAFTIAHSISLAVAALQIWAPGAKIVEPAIALSIAYIGIENWFVKDVSRRWLITFPFGLIHGFGFASALHQISLPHAEIPLALFSFNAGVEAGQLAVLALVLPAILWLRRYPWFRDRGAKVVSGAIALAGACWFLIRIGQ